MRDLKIKKTYVVDFEKIYPLLREFNSPYAKKNWKKIFTYQWDGIEDYVGFHLECNENVVGFMGLIFSRRYIHGHTYKFCNITSLIIKKNYRAATFLLMRKITQIKDTIFISLSPIYESYCIFIKLGFSPIEQHYVIIPAIYNNMIKKEHRAKVYELPVLFDKLDSENKRILIDHISCDCSGILIERNNSNCLLIYKITYQNYLMIPLIKIHLIYISDISLFNENLCDILKFFKIQLGWRSAIYLDRRFLDRRHSLPLITKKTVAPKVLLYNPYKNKINIDALYSEVILL